MESNLYTHCGSLVPGVGSGTVRPLTHPGRPLQRILGAILLFFLCVLSSRLYAQSAASINGTVKDTTGAMLSGASVLLTNTDTGVKQLASTTTAGLYAIPNVRPGNYTIVVDKKGFESAKELQIVLQVNQAATFNFVLPVGAVADVVTVSSAASSVETSTAALGTVITTQAVNDLPLNGRNFTQLLELTPGVSRISVDQNSSGGSGISGNAIGTFTFPAVNGQRNRSNMFLLDGVNDLGSYFGTYNYQPIVDGIQEFKVQSHNDLAEFGGVSGGIINVVTKGGTNQIHGSAWEFLRNSAFDARNYFLPTVNPLRQNQFGVTVGGPVVIPHLYNGHNKTFFFFAYEGFRNSQAAQTLLTTPTAVQLNGNFGNLYANGVDIYNPFSTTPDPNHPGEYLRTAFPQDQIPTNMISPAALLYAKTIFPAPNASGLSGGRNLIDTTPERLNSDSFTGRIDQAFGEHDLLFGRVSYFNEPSSTTGGFPGVLDTTTVDGWNFAVHEEHIFGPRSILELSFGRNVGYANEEGTFSDAPSGFANQLMAAGFSSQFIGSFAQPMIPEFDITGYLSDVGSGGNIITYHQFTNTWEYGGSYTRILGRHTLKFGGNFATNNYQLADVEAEETTSTFQTSNLEHPTSASGASTGDALASFLLGVPTSAGYRYTTQQEHGGWVDSAYAQDQIQVNPRLAVNVGLRWDVSIWPVLSTNNNGSTGDMDLNNGTFILGALPPACSATVGAPCIPGGALPADVVVSQNKNGALHNTDFSNWQGRVGLAYHPLDKLSITAGYGRFYDNWNGVTQLAQDSGGAWPSVSTLTAATLNSTTPTALIGNPLSQGTGSIVTPPATPFGTNGDFFNPDMKTPFSDQWNLGITQGFGANTVLSVIYSGSHSSRLDIHALQNTAEYAAAGTAAQVASRREYPYIVPITYDQSTGNSNYNALQTTLKKVTSNGLTYLLSYTWSKSIDVACSGIYGGCLLQNPYDPKADRSVSGFDLTNIGSLSVDYQLPFGRTKNLFLGSNWGDHIGNVALGGWAVNGIGSFSSGTPYSVTVTGDIANTGNTEVQADLVGNPNPAHRSANEWINPAAFASPPAYSFGTFGRNALRSDGYRNLDLSVFKNFRLPRETSLQFRAEAFNATNTVVFSAPSSVVGTTTFGTVGSTANTPRELQFALKVVF